MLKLLNNEPYYLRAKYFFGRRGMRCRQSSNLYSAIGIRLFLTFTLTVSLTAPSLAHLQSSQQPTGSSPISEFAVLLAGAATEAEQEQLLAAKKDLINSELLSALKTISDPLIQKGDYTRALRITQLSIRLAERIEDRSALARALCDLGAIHSRQNRGAEGLNPLQKCLAIAEETGDKRRKAQALNSIGYAYSSQRQFEKALEYYEKSLSVNEEVGDRNLTALVFNSMGLAHSALGHYDLGLELYEKSRALSEELNDKVTLELTFNNIATHYISHGRYAEALDYLQKSLKLKEEMGDQNKSSMAIRLQNIGLIYRRQGRMEQALAYARRSLEILEELDDQFGIANLQNNIGVIYKSQGLYDEGLDWFQKSLQRYEKLQVKAGIARSLNNIGDTYRLQGRFDQASEPLMKSLSLREQSNDRGGVCLTLNNLSRLYQDQRKYAEMLTVSRRAAAVAEEINAPEELWAAQERIGRALAAVGQPEEARRSFLSAIATIEYLRREVAGGEQQQQSFLENRVSPWLGLITLLVSQREYTEALRVAEQSKARVLVDALQGRASLRESLSPRERQTEEEQRLRLVSLNSQLTNELRREKPDRTRVNELKASIAKARLDQEALETNLYVVHPELKVHRGEAPIINGEELANLLPDAATALLEYVVTDDETYLFVVTRSSGSEKAEVRVYALPVKRDELAKQTEIFRRQLAGRDLGFRGSASKLYESLLKPAESQLRGKANLVIAPDATLWDLPFQALVTGANRLLIEEAAVAYAPSLTALRDMEKRRTKQSGNETSTALLAIGNPTLGQETIRRAALTLRDEKLDPLPEAEQEVRAIARLYGTTHSKIYIGREAREDYVKNEAGRARILHFAAHGMLNDASPMYSHLALAPGGAREDGLLEAWELMRLDLKADLAVLSACDTARGRIGPGEGIIGFSWAMFIAGVPSIVVSQWKVESASTRDLMVNLHRALMPSPRSGRAVGLTKAQALRQAALKVMRNPGTSHPFYWAGFVLVGDGR